MAVSSPSTRNADQSYRRQALIWLLVTLLLGVITALVLDVQPNASDGCQD